MESNLRLDLYYSFVLYTLFCVFVKLDAMDNFGLLYGTLRTFQAHACDGEELRLNCTSDTVISINFVRYGRQKGSGHLCPSTDISDSTACRLDSALKVIEAKCRGQMLCRMLISPDTFYEDPCPGVRKYAEVAYKCRPENFRNKVVCEGERLSLSCPKDQLIIIYSATFGTSSSGVLECPQTDNMKYADCQVSYATETVMRTCSGQQMCSLTADVDTFGNPNCMGRKHLKVTYNCLDRELLLVRIPTGIRSTEESIHTTSFPAWVRGVDQSLQNNQRFHGYARKASTKPSNDYKSEMQSDEVPTDNGSSGPSKNQTIVGFLSEWMSVHKYVEGNKHKLILYVSVSLLVGFTAFLTVLGARFLIQRIVFRRNSKLDVTPVTDDDQFFSDSDLEQYEPPETLPTPAVNYTASIRRHDSDAQPRAPVTTGSELNHYFS